MAKTKPDPDEEEFNFEEEVDPSQKPKRTRTYETDSELPEDEPAVRYDPISKKDASLRWDNRRRMAWLALVSMIITTVLMMFVVDTTRLDSLEVIISWFYMGCVSVIGSYMGFTTYASIKGVKESK